MVSAGAALLALLSITFADPAGAESAERLVLAFYYPWYMTVEHSGYCTWNFGGFKYDESDQVCEQNTNTPRLPAGGLYDSLSPATVKMHLQQSRRAGLDGWVVSWWGQGHQTDALDLLLEQAQSFDPRFKMAVYYEMIPGCRGFVCTEAKRTQRKQAVIDDFRYLNQRYFSHPSYLKVDGRPVVFIYSRAMLHGAWQWTGIIEALREEMPLYLSGDCATTFLDPLVPRETQKPRPVAVLLALAVRRYRRMAPCVTRPCPPSGPAPGEQRVTVLADQRHPERVQPEVEGIKVRMAARPATG